MIDIGMMYAMAALPLAVEGGSSTGLMIGVAVASFAVGAIVFSLIFRRKVAIDSNLAENARKEAAAIKAEAEKDANMIREKADLEAEKTRNRALQPYCPYLFIFIIFDNFTFLHSGRRRKIAFEIARYNF